MDSSLFLQENERLKNYELSSQRQMEKKDETDGTELGYRDANTRFLELEKNATKKDQWAQKAEEHKQRKKNLEAAWHRSTTEKAADLSKRAGSDNKKEKAYYQNFSLKELEIFIKNSDRGGNSETYNNVVTDLELYNRLSGQVEQNESFTLLTRLADSCRTYLREHNKAIMWTSKGKIRKAMIAQLTDKVNMLLETRTTQLVDETKSSYEALSSEKSEKNVNRAAKAHFNRIWQHLQGNVTMKEEEMGQVDTQMAEVFDELKKQKVDSNQSDTMPTKFFNAIGWAENKPRLTDKIDKEAKNSPLKRKAYHAIEPIPGQENAIGMAKQLAGTGEGTNRQFYSDGMYGRGTYLAISSDMKDASDEKTAEHDWIYGQPKGSVQVVLCLNERSRIIRERDLKDMVEDKFMKQFPKLYQKIAGIYSSGRKRSGSEYITIFGAFFGYNTVKGYAGSSDNLTDYYVTVDRSAMTISRRGEVSKVMKADFTERDNFIL